MVVGEVSLVAQSHDAQGGGDRAFAGGEDGPDGQDLRVGPDAVGKQWSEGCQEDYHLRWQWHGGRLPGAMTLATSHRSYEATSRSCQSSWPKSRYMLSTNSTARRL